MTSLCDTLGTITLIAQSTLLHIYIIKNMVICFVIYDSYHYEYVRQTTTIYERTFFVLFTIKMDTRIIVLKTQNVFTCLHILRNNWMKLTKSWQTKYIIWNRYLELKTTYIKIISIVSMSIQWSKFVLANMLLTTNHLRFPT